MAFQDDKYAGPLKEFGIEAFHLCKEKRAHYIMDDYKEGPFHFSMIGINRKESKDVDEIP